MYGCCPVVVDRCLILSHTQCNHSPAWSIKWASEVCLSPPHFKWATTRMRLRPPCAVSLAQWCASWMRSASPTTAQGTSWNPPLAEVCFHSSQWGTSEPGIGVQWNARLCTCGKLETIHCRKFLHDIYCLLQMSLHGGQGAPTKTNYQVVNKMPWRCPWQYKVPCGIQLKVILQGLVNLIRHVFWILH